MYVIILCPKCKKHAQIVQSATASTRCQVCGKSLDMKHVRVFARCTDLDDAVARCTALKAHLHGQDDGLKDAIERGELSDIGSGGSGDDDNYNCAKFDDDKLAFENRVDERLKKNTAKRGQRKIFTQCLAKLSKMDSGTSIDITIDRLTECLGEYGFNLKKVEEYIQKMKHEGVLYEPKNGVIRYIEG